LDIPFTLAFRNDFGIRGIAVTYGGWIFGSGDVGRAVGLVDGLLDGGLGNSGLDRGVMCLSIYAGYRETRRRKLAGIPCGAA